MNKQKALDDAWVKLENSCNMVRCGICFEKLPIAYAYYQNGIFFHGKCVSKSVRKRTNYLFGVDDEE